MDFTVGIVSRNLATTSNFVEFRDRRNFMFFKARRGCMTLGTFWVAQRRHVSSADAVKLDVKWGSLVTHGMMPLEGNLKWLDKRIRCNPLNQ